MAMASNYCSLVPGAQFLNGGTPGVYIVHGAASLPGQTYDQLVPATMANLTFCSVTSGGSPVGAHVDTGDFDGDGIDDLCFNSNTRIEILHGAIDLPRGTIAMGAPPLGTRVTRVLSSSIFGDRCAVGVVDQEQTNPGADELIFGVGSFNTGTSASIKGTFGRIAGIGEHAGQTINVDGANANMLSRVSNTTIAAEYGTPIIAEDIDGDAVPELVATGVASLRGTIHAGSFSGLPASGSIALSAFPPAFRLLAANPARINDFGSALITGGDLDGDGAPDIAIAAPYQSFPFDSANSRGVVGVVFGGSAAESTSASRYLIPGATRLRGSEAAAPPEPGPGSNSTLIAQGLPSSCRQ